MLYTEQPTHISFHHQGAICLVECQGKWLLLQNISGDDHGDLWGSPGGKVEPGESALDAVIRELYEETALRFKPVDIRFVSKVYMVPIDRKPYVLHVFRVSLSECPRAIHLDEREHQQYGWFTPEEVLQQPLLPGSRELTQLLDMQ